MTLNRLRMKWQLHMSRPMLERGPISRLVHAAMRVVLRPYYRRLPEFLQAYGPWRAFVLLCDNYRHIQEVELPSARKIEGMALKEASHERRLRIHAETRLLGVDEETMKHINSVFGTDLPEKQMD